MSIYSTIYNIKEDRPILFLTCHNENLVPISVIKEIRSLGVPTALICFDNLLIPFDHKNVCSYYDVVWLTSIETEYLFKKWGANTVFLPYAANPYAFRYIERDEINRAVFMGTPYGSRANLINELTLENIPVTLFGKQNVGKESHVLTKGFVTTVKEDLQFGIGRKLLVAAAKQRLTPAAVLNQDAASLERKGFADDMAEVYGSYALSISSTSARNTGILKNPVDVVNLRSFEIPMCGGIQFCKYNEELSHYFEEDKEIIFYCSHKDMIEKARYYTAEKSLNQRKKIRQAARKRAKSEHTWYCRFNKLLSAIGIRI